jgi:hypothetical protein
MWYEVHARLFRGRCLSGFDDQLAFDCLVIPGGMPGAKTISTNAAVQKLVRDYINGGKIVGMICAGKMDIVLLEQYLKTTARLFACVLGQVPSPRSPVGCRGNQ